MSESNKDLVRRWIDEVFNAERVEVAEQLVAAEFVEHALAPFGQQAPGRVDGPVHTRATVEYLRAQFPDIQMTIEAMAAEEDLVAVLDSATGTNLGLLNGILPPTGRPFHAQQSHWSGWLTEGSPSIGRPGTT